MQETDKNTEASKSEDLEWNSSASGGEPDRVEYFAPLTADYLLERGYCCGNGCKNCPYDYKAVPEPRRTQLLDQRKKDESNK